MSALIYLVDDDRNITTSVTIALESEGYRVQSFHDGEAGFEGIKSETPDLAILDVKMPRMDGLELLQEIRKNWDALPVIMLTSVDDEVDQIIGLRMGADDYITKPFSQRLLMERIRALLRRHHSSANQSDDKALESGLLHMDDARFICMWDGKIVDLTITEYLIVKFLASDANAVKTREALIEAAYDERNAPDAKTIDTHIKRIRQKFKHVDVDFQHIESVYGAGYRYKHV